MNSDNSDNSDNRDLLNQVKFGMEVEQFLDSKVGKYLIERAEMQAAEATEQLKRVAPEDSLQIRALQTLIARAESIQFWMAECIQIGLHAQSELRQQDE